MTNDKNLVVSTDGSALSNPNGPMGWAWADQEGGDADAGGASNGTNQIGELCAVLQALRAHPGEHPLVIETDSQYAINCSTTWVPGWKKKGWKNSQGKPVKNRPLIEAIDREIQARQGSVRFVWVKGHAGNTFNEKVDTLARGYATAAGKGNREGYLPIEGWRSLLASPYAKGTQVPPAVKDELDGGPQVLDELGRKKARLDQKEQKDLAETAVESEAVDAEQAESVEATTVADNDTPDPDMADGQEDEVAPASKDTSDADTVDQETRNSGARGLRASGRIRITPPPSGSSMFTGQDLHIVGSIDIDADIDPDGYVTIQEAPFRLHAIEVED
ncbi:ribonuclease HI [Bifidobacterium sp. W8101]|uniref:ribonuclease H family protein n=1 Tax=Bifidobacterium TaxID=1678 RepID=UPI0018DE227A|nr:MULTISPECIES: ribonuclease H [Bifidobacterium]MBI0126564.1 ribonuclease HI [Bifidobacterium choladohabitans]MBI0128133.1 ribonuclease HI [Bifidobacterium sp. W8103]MBI0138721.1 ribonuclease HI [Bifidobacterium sp. W8105]MBI0148309.1 ribonuclease HI [Bifidobacterium sp. W8107]